MTSESKASRSKAPDNSGSLPPVATLDNYASADAVMQRCLRLARMAAKAPLPVLVLGESGTGKTMIAQAIHNSSARAGGAFVSFNAAALSDTLLDSQLFGHEKGAFTGADRQVKGKFELADQGTLFFDEIADLTLTGQAKILRAVEGGEFERLGSEKSRHADVRLITATCRPIQEFVENRRFRQDLFYRIKGITLSIPPLRDRRNDLPRMIRSEIVRSARAMNKTVTGIEEDALKLLLSHSWPGNLREVRQVIQVAVAVAETDTIDADAIILDSFTMQPAQGETANAAPSTAGAANETLESVEKRHIEHVLAAHGGNKRQTAKTLGVSRSTLDRKLQNYGLE